MIRYFPDAVIHKQALDRLVRGLAGNRLAHAYLFHGPEGSGKEAAALELAKAVNCTDAQNRPCNACASCQKINHLNHPDIQFVFPVLKSWIPKDIDKEVRKRLALKAENPYRRINNDPRTVIPIDRIRELKTEAKYAPYERGKKIYIISDADKMQREAANALLKLLEEPPEELHLVLTTASLNTMLDTIRSRCQLIYFPALTPAEATAVVARYRTVTEELANLIRLFEGNLKQIFDSDETDTGRKSRIVYDYLKAIAAANVLALHELTEQMTRPRDKKYLMDLLNLLILWFKDAVSLTTLGPQAEIANTAFKDELQRFAGVYARSDFMKIINVIENAVSNLNRNVYAPAVLTVLAIKIKENLIRSE